jgi:hypothetical protein
MADKPTQDILDALTKIQAEQKEQGKDLVNVAKFVMSQTGIEMQGGNIPVKSPHTVARARALITHREVIDPITKFLNKQFKQQYEFDKLRDDTY